LLLHLRCTQVALTEDGLYFGKIGTDKLIDFYPLEEVRAATHEIPEFLHLQLHLRFF
jgi:hypothetical protein